MEGQASGQTITFDGFDGFLTGFAAYFHYDGFDGFLTGFRRATT
jgi:hypothetical protein